MRSAKAKRQANISNSTHRRWQLLLSATTTTQPNPFVIIILIEILLIWILLRGFVPTPFPRRAPSNRFKTEIYSWKLLFFISFFFVLFCFVFSPLVFCSPKDHSLILTKVINSLSARLFSPSNRESQNVILQRIGNHVQAVACYGRAVLFVSNDETIWRFPQSKDDKLERANRFSTDWL